VNVNESKLLKNKHDPEPAAESPNPATIRSRRYRDRKRKGIVLLQAEIQPDMTQALVQLGWLHESEARNRASVVAAIGALVLRALSAGVTPSQKALIEVDPAAVLDAASWLRPGVQLSQQTAGQALETLSAGAATVGFGPAAYAQRLNAMVREIEARGIVGAAREGRHKPPMS
jgi:hypothetical protein